MSNQWEVVSKSRKQKNLDKKVSAHTEQKRIAAQLPKLEDLLPTQQYRNLFGSTNNNNNYKSNSPAKSSSSASSSKNKSPVKKNATKTITTGGSSGGGPKTKKQLPAKPKTLEEALKHISPDDFAAQLEQIKLSCPGFEMRWLSHIALYFNGALSYDCDPVFSGRSSQYPSNLASAGLQKLVVDFLGSVGESNLEYFFYSLLDGMTSDLNNNQTVVGYKFMLQLIGQAYPSICSKNFAKTALLRNCYQNRSSICLSILWAIGQGGYRSLNEGVKVWQNLMLPNLELKSYSKFVVEYIERVLKAATAGTSEDTLLLNQNEFFATYNALNATYNNLAMTLQLSLRRSANKLLQIYIASPVKHANIFLTLFRDITTIRWPDNEIEGCLSCLLSSGGDDCFKVWRMNYKKQQLASYKLLQAIDVNWKTSTNLLAKSPAFHSFLQDLRLLNEELQSSKRKENHLIINDLIEVLVTVQEKSSAQQKKNKQNSASQKKKCGCCKWTLGSIFIIALIAGALYYDTEVNGKGLFEKSATGKVLKNAGVLPHVQKGWYVTMGASARGYKWAEKHVPPYAEPALKTAGDLWKLARNAACNVFQSGKGYFNTKWPVIAKFIDQYVPNLSGKLEAFVAGACDLAVNSYDKSAALIKEKVLVGRFSPENINQALNQTRNVALEYYNQFHKKVDAYAKLK